MNYLKAEHIKYKRTVSNKLLWIAPLMTTIFAWIVGGFYGFQYMSFYWWYSFILPGTIAILCVLSHLKEESAGKYCSVFSLPLDLTKFEIAKSLVMLEKMFVAACALTLFVSISNLISPAFAVYSIKRSMLGSIAIVLTSMWQIPLCTYLTRKIGTVLPIIFNTLLGIFSPFIIGSAKAEWVWPYCWTGKVAEILLGIKNNGTYEHNDTISGLIVIPFVLSILFFVFLAVLDAKKFAKGEVK